MGFFKGALKIAIAIVLAIVALGVLAGIVAYWYDAHQKSKARPYEMVKGWSYDASEPLGLKFAGRTKLVDNRLYADLRFDGNPPYLKSAANSSPNSKASITVHFKDKDGFKVYEKTVGLREFTTLLNKGAAAGLTFEYDEFVGVETYARFDHVELMWNLDTSVPKPFIDPDDAKWESPAADHCAPDLSKAERLKRLGKHGSVREIGLNEYSAGGRSIKFLNATELLNCR
jgi:hypothetical protein